MSTTSTATTAKEPLSLLTDIILNENDLTEEAKSRFTYHTDILNAYDGYRRRILRDENSSNISRHLLFSNLSRCYTRCKQVLNYMAQNNELLSCDLPIVGPVVICSLPRTGSTLLHNLLACDPHCRAPLYTEMRVESVPPIARTNSVEQERRITMLRSLAKEKKDLRGGIEVDFKLSHPSYAIEEDYFILEQAGSAVYFSVMISDGQSEFDTYLSDEMKKDFAYDYHETFLRMLNSVDSPCSHWLLKTGAHLFYLNTLLRHYRNAALIMTHRSLNEVLPSFYHLMFHIENIYLIKANSPSARKTLTAQYTQFIDRMLENLIKFRTQQSKKNIFDVIYDDLMEQPIPTVRRIYDYFNLRWSDEFEVAMQSWLRDNPQGKQGRQTYSLAEFGLTHEDIEARYIDYTNLFLRSSSSGNT